MKAATAAGHDVLTRKWWAAVRARSTEKLKATATESTTTAATAKLNEAPAKEPKDDDRDAIIAALKSRQMDRIIPYLPDGDDPIMIKIQEMEERYGVYHDPPSSSDDSEEYIPPY